MYPSRAVEYPFDTLPLMVVLLDAQGAIVGFNRVAEQVTGFAANAVLHHSWADALTPRDRLPDAWERLRGYSPLALPGHFESPLVTAAGEERYVLWQTADRSEAGNPAGAILFGMDVTERRQIEERHIRLATLVESVHEAIIGMDARQVITSWNAGAQTIFGYGAGEVVGGPASVIFPETVLQIAQRLARGERTEDRTDELETTLHSREGRPVSAVLALSAVHDSAGRPLGTAAVVRDITGQKALQAEIIRAQRLESLASLATGVAHHFNNINTVIEGYLDALLHGANLSDAGRKYAAEIMKGVRRSVEITDRLLELTGAGAGSAETAALAGPVQAVLSLLAPQIREASVELSTDLQEDPRVLAGEGLLRFVTTALCVNSLHALLERSERRLVLRTRTGGGFGQLEVTDTGCGIPSADIPRVFTPFYTTKGEWAPPHSPQARVKGIGLSLAVAQSSIAERGGWIEVESVEGEGTTFRVSVPVA